MASLWGRLAGFYGHKWISSYGEDPLSVAGDTWAAGLATLTPEQLGAGLRAVEVRPDPWPPSMQEFRALCLGIPNFAECVHQLRPGHPDPSPFVRVMWRYLDPYRLRHAHEGAAASMLRTAYELAAAHVMRGGELPAPSCAIAHEPDADRALYDEIHFARMRNLAEVANAENAVKHTGANNEGDAE